MTRPAAVVASLMALSGLAQGDQVVVTGTVRDSEGNPVPSADVWTVPFPYRTAFEGKTAAHGTFALTVEAEPAEKLEVLAVAAGLALGNAGYDPGAPGPVSIVLQAASEVRGVVVGERGQPIAGAEVVPNTVQHDTALGLGLAFLGKMSPIRATTDAEGRFVLGQLPEGASVGLTVQAAGFACWRPWSSRDGRWATAGATADFRIALEPAAAIRGTVTHNGRAAPDVAIMAERVLLPGEEAGAGDDRARTRTGPGGTYELEGLRSGQYNVVVEDVSELVAPAHEGVEVAAGETSTSVDFELTPGGMVEGRVVDRDTGEGIPDAEVSCSGPHRPPSGRFRSSARTDAAGGYHLRVASGTSSVCCTRAPSDYPHADDVVVDVAVGEGQAVTAPDLVLAGVTPIEVRVVDPRGNPVQGVEVTPPSPGRVAGQTDAEGRCLVRGIGPERMRSQTTVLFAHTPDGELCGATSIPPGAQPGATVTITIDRGATVRLRLNDPRGKPVPGVEISAWGLGSSVPVISRARSDDTGTVELTGLPANVKPGFSVNLRVSNPSDWQPECPVLEAGRAYDLGVATLHTNPPTLAVSGTVVMPDGTPAMGAVVRAGLNQTITTDQQGRFEIPGVAAFEALGLAAESMDGHLVGVVEVTADGQFEPEIRLAETGGLSGQVIDAAGNVQRHNRVRIEPQGIEFGPHIPGFVETRTDADGRFSVAGLPSGLTYQVLVARPGNRLETVATILLEPGESLDLGELACRD